MIFPDVLKLTYIIMNLGAKHGSTVYYRYLRAIKSMATNFAAKPPKLCCNTFVYDGVHAASQPNCPP